MKLHRFARSISGELERDWHCSEETGLGSLLLLVLRLIFVKELKVML